MVGPSIEINHNRDKDVSLNDIIKVARGAPVHVPKQTLMLLEDRRTHIEEYIRDTKQPAYGFNRGFGSNVRIDVDPKYLTDLQENLIRSHACCLGEWAHYEVIRATMFLRARSLSLGHSAVRPDIVRRLVDALNAGVIPVVPSFGSVSASGDLAPLSHIALGLFLGEGEAFVIKPGSKPSLSELKPMPALQALSEAGLKPLALEMKEGLALNNGVQYSTALCALSAEKLLIILKTAVIATALSALVMLGADTPFREDLHQLRKHRATQVIAKCVFELMKGSPLREAHLNYDIDGEIQDPFNLRCAAQILGPCLELVRRAVHTVTNEANSVTDNPIILRAWRHSGIDHLDQYHGKYDGKYVEVVSGGHFHGMPIAVDAYGLIQAVSIIARLSNMRCVRFVDADRNKGLGADLKWPGRIPPREHWTTPDQYAPDEIETHQATQSAMMIPEYASASLTNWIWGQAMPNHLFSLSTDAGQEDHVSMAANVALKAYTILPRLAEVVAIELAFAYQAAAIRKYAPVIPSRAPKYNAARAGEIVEWVQIKEPAKRNLNEVGETVLELIGRYFPTVTKDRSMAAQISKLAELVLDGQIVNTVEDKGDYFTNFALQLQD